MRAFHLFQFVFLLCGSLALQFFAGGAHLHDSSLSFLLGAVFSWLNLASIHFFWSLLIKKKLIALSVSGIVIKYPLLGFLMYKILKLEGFSLGWFCVGLGTIILTCVVATLKLSLNEHFNSVSS